mgnify:FL=1
MAYVPQWQLFCTQHDVRWRIKPGQCVCACETPNLACEPSDFGRVMSVWWNPHGLQWSKILIPQYFTGYFQCDACGFRIAFDAYDGHEYATKESVMPKYPGGKYGPNHAERGGHVPERGEIEHFVEGDAMVPGQPATKTMMPMPSIDEVMAMPHHVPVRGEKEGFGASELPQPATKKPMGHMGKRGS